MTHFCGVIDWRGLGPDGPDQRLAAVRAMARGGGSVREYRDATAWIACLDQGHFAGGGLQHLATGDVGCVSGQALLEPGPRDAAALLAAVAAADEACLAGVRGQFAACTWSPTSRTLRLCADALAVRPIYVRAGANRVRFATSFRALLLLAGEALSLDEEALGALLYGKNELGDSTLYREIRLIGPGELASFTPRTRSTSVYFDWSAIEPIALERDRASRLLHEIFAEAVALRAPGGPIEATLSGGMDSRAVVAALVDAGERPRCWTLADEGSADKGLAEAVARALDVEQHSVVMPPADDLRRMYIPVAQRLRAGWNALGLYGSGTPVRLWTGHGGGVGLGHARMTPATVSAVGSGESTAAALALFPKLARPASRLAPRGRAELLRRRALSSVVAQFERVGRVRPERRLWLYLMLNLECRHTHWQNQDIDLTGVEMVSPFLDTRFLQYVAGLPVEWFLHHAFYNDWMGGFACPAISVAWQHYPGHVPPPVPMPAGLMTQWEFRPETCPEVRRDLLATAEQVLRRPHPELALWFSPLRIRIVRSAIALGHAGLLFELSKLRRIYRAAEGQIPMVDPQPDHWEAPRLVPLDSNPGEDGQAPGIRAVAA